MSFTNVGLIGSLLGLLLLAGVFFLLQRLRVRHRPVVVETALFWKQAVEESRARVFVQRFRHPWTYLLLLSIASLLWLAFAGPRLLQAGEREHLVLLDGSAAMAHGDRFERAAEQAVAYAAGLPVGRRSVLLCQGRPQTLLRPGEELVLLEQRLAERRAAACPASIAHTLASYGHRLGSKPLEVCVIGDAPLDADELAALPASFTVTRMQVAGDGDANRGITALGVRAAVSGRWDAVDVLVEVAVTGGLAPSAPTLTVDGKAVAVAPVVEDTAGGARYRFVDLPAHGGVLEARLAGEDDLGLDDVARFALPDRRPLRVAIGPGVPDIIRQLVAADPGLLRVDDAATVVIRRRGSALGELLPAIELVDREAAEDAFFVMLERDDDAQAVLRELYETLGLAEIDAMSLAQATGRTISMGAAPGSIRQLWIWQELLRDDYDFTSSRSFPLLFGLGIRWLAGADEGPVRTAVGEPLALRGAEVDGPYGRTVRSLRPTFVPMQAGDHSTDRGQRFAASLLDPVSTLGAAAADDLPAATVGASAQFDLVTLLLVLALLLLGFEWWLYRKGTIA